MFLLRKLRLEKMLLPSSRFYHRCESLVINSSLNKTSIMSRDTRNTPAAIFIYLHLFLQKPMILWELIRPHQTRRESFNGDFCAVEEARLLIRLRGCPFVVRFIRLRIDTYKLLFQPDEFRPFWQFLRTIPYIHLCQGELHRLLRRDPRELYLDGAARRKRSLSGAAVFHVHNFRL